MVDMVVDAVSFRMLCRTTVHPTTCRKLIPLTQHIGLGGQLAENNYNPSRPHGGQSTHQIIHNLKPAN